MDLMIQGVRDRGEGKDFGNLWERWVGGLNLDNVPLGLWGGRGGETREGRLWRWGEEKKIIRGRSRKEGKCFFIEKGSEGDPEPGVVVLLPTLGGGGVLGAGVLDALSMKSVEG